ILHHHRAAPHLAALCRRTHHHRHPLPAHFPTPCLFLCLSAPTSSEPASRATPLPPILTRCRFSSSAATKAVFSRPEGIEALCLDLEVDYTDIKILILAWKMNAQKQGYFTQDEWRRGLKALRVDNIKKLKKSLPELKKEIQSDYKVMNMDQWKNFLRFCEEISFPDLRNYDTCEA
ncbi:defective in cullin neddylation protein, partial [Striga asiatica]